MLYLRIVSILTHTGTKFAQKTCAISYENKFLYPLLYRYRTVYSVAESVLLAAVIGCGIRKQVAVPIIYLNRVNCA